MKKSTFVAAILTPVFMAGCKAVPTPEITAPQQPFVGYAVDLVTLVDRGDALTFTDPGNLPTSGSATYDGVAILVPDTAPDLLGDAQIVADFKDGSLQGVAGNFVSEADEFFDGEVLFKNMNIDRNANTAVDYTFGGTVTGALTNGVEVYNLAGFVEGDFLGAQHQIIYGEGVGTITGTVSENFEIGFVAEK